MFTQGQRSTYYCPSCQVTALTRAILAHLGDVDPVMKRLIAAVGPFEMEPRAEQTPYEALARAIAHQQLNGRAAQSILNRFVTTCGQGLFPGPAALLALEDAQLRAAGFCREDQGAAGAGRKDTQRCGAELEALHALEDPQIIERLTAVRGIGRWTVEMMLMFHLRRPDVLPVDDFGVRQGFQLAYGQRHMPAPRAIALYGQRWSPYRSAAAWYLWRAVDLHRAGALPPPAQVTRLPRPPRRLKRAAACAAPPAPAGGRTRARPRPAPRSRAPAKKK